MIVFFLEEDLVSFGNYMISPERRQLFEANPDPSGLTLEERLSKVHDADLANWAYINNQTPNLNNNEYIG